MGRNNLRVEDAPEKGVWDREGVDQEVETVPGQLGALVATGADGHRAGPGGSGTPNVLHIVTVAMQDAVTLEAPVSNPVSSTATVSFTIKEQVKTTLTLYNTLGQLVATLYDGTPPANEPQTVQVNATGLPSGTYFLWLEAEGTTRTQRLRLCVRMGCLRGHLPQSCDGRGSGAKTRP